MSNTLDADTSRPYADLNDALRVVVQALGGTKKVAAALKPDQTAATSLAWINSCLNTEQPAHFTPQQLLWLFKEGAKINCHVAMQFVAGEAGYAPPVPQSPRNELAALTEAIERQQHATVRQLEQLNLALSRAKALQSPGGN